MPKNSNSKVSQPVVRQKSTPKQVPAAADIKSMVIQEEAKTFDHVIAIIHAQLDPENADLSKVPNARESGPCADALLKGVFELNVPNAPDNNFRLISYPRFQKPVYMTDVEELVPTHWFFERFFNPMSAPDSETEVPYMFEPGALYASDDLPASRDVYCMAANSNAMMIPNRQFIHGEWAWVLDFDFTYYCEIPGAAPYTCVSTFIRGEFTSRPIVHWTIGGTNYSTEMVPYTDADEPAGYRYDITTNDPYVVLHRIWFTTQPVRVSYSFRGQIEFKIAEQAIGSPSVLYAKDMDLYDDLQNVAERVGVLGQVHTQSYRGSTLQDGGVTAGLQLLRGYAFSPHAASTYNALAQIPSSYNGPLRTGTHVTWLPEDFVRTMSQSTQTISPDLERIAIAGRADDPTQTNVLEVVQAIRFTTHSRLWKAYPRAVDAHAWDIAATILSRYARASCNPDHVTRIKKMLRHLYTHRDLIKKGVLTAAQAGKILAGIAMTV